VKNRTCLTVFIGQLFFGSEFQTADAAL